MVSMNQERKCKKYGFWIEAGKKVNEMTLIQFLCKTCAAERFKWLNSGQKVSDKVKCPRCKKILDIDKRVNEDNFLGIFILRLCALNAIQ